MRIFCAVGQRHKMGLVPAPLETESRQFAAIPQRYWCIVAKYAPRPALIYTPVTRLFSATSTSKIAPASIGHDAEMITSRQVLDAVANIQDELSKISAVASLLDSKPDGDNGDFQKKIVSEFNQKLRRIKLNNRALKEENTALKLKIRQLQVQILGKAASTDDAFKTSVSMAPPTKKAHEDRVVILSSPIKNGDSDPEALMPSPGKPKSKQTPDVDKQSLMEDEPPKSDLTSSQFNGLPTQYSDSSSQNHGLAVFEQQDRQNVFADISPPKKRKKSKEADNVEFVGEEVDNPRVVADSQDEIEPVGEKSHRLSISDSVPRYPAHYTALQRVEFLRLYYQAKKKDPSFRIDLRRNPISEKTWALDDFVPNPDWKPATKMNTKLGTMTKHQEKAYRDFFNEAGLGKRMVGPIWDSDDRDNGDDLDWDRSQVMDKYLSPPGYMTGDFVSTQEAKEQKKAAKHKQQERIKRRFASVLARGEFIFYEEILNSFVQSKHYTNAEPVFSKKEA